MEFFADILLVLGALGAGIYCFVLSRRLNRFNSLESGIGGAVATLSAQVDDLEKSLKAAQKSASESAKTLTNLTERAETIGRELELKMASLHDISANTDEQKTATPINLSTDINEPMFVRHNADGAAE